MFRVTSVLLLLIAIVGDTRADGPDLATLRQDLLNIREDYARWGVMVTRTRKEVSFQKGLIDRLGTKEFEVGEPTPATELCLIDGTRFRHERIDPNDPFLSFRRVSDGRVRRNRDVQRSMNRGESGFWLEHARPAIPHSLSSHEAIFNLRWLFGDQLIDPINDKLNYLVKIREYEQETLRGMTCRKIAWTWSSGYGVDLRSEVWLAKDRGSLPIRYRHESESSLFLSEMIDFQSVRHEDRELWFPKRIQSMVRSNSTWTLQIDQYELRDIPGRSGFGVVKSLAPPIVKKRTRPHGMPTWMPSRSAISRFNEEAKRFRIIAGSVSFVILLVSAVLMRFWGQSSRTGKRVRGLVKKHPIGFGFLGCFSAGLTFCLCCLCPGWWRTGLATMLTGIYAGTLMALAWALVGGRSFSMRSALGGCAAASLVFAGYSSGIQRIHSRQRMVRQIEAEGGTVGFRFFKQTSPSRRIPELTEKLLGTAAMGEVRSISIPPELSRRDRWSGWPVNELDHIAIYHFGENPFLILGSDFEPLRESRIRDLTLIGGNLSPECYSTVKSMPNLRALRIDCGGSPIDPSVGHLTGLRKLHLVGAAVDDEFFETLSRTTLSSLTLQSPTFDPVRSDTVLPGVEILTIQSATLTPDVIRIISKMSSVVNLTDCGFLFKPGEKISFSDVSVLFVTDSDLFDRDLLMFADAPSLQEVRMEGTGVTPAGLDAFTLRRPDVTLDLIH